MKFGDVWRYNWSSGGEEIVMVVAPAASEHPSPQSITLVLSDIPAYSTSVGEIEINVIGYPKPLWSKESE